jgi:hypothetical protein
MARKRTKLDAKEAKLLRGIIAGEQVIEAANNAKLVEGGSREVNRVTAYEVLRRPHVAAALEAALDEAGATVKASAQVIAAGHKASTVKVFNDKKKGLVYATPLVDHPTRMKAAELSLRARRLIGSGPEEGGGNQTVNLFAVLSVVRQASGERGLPL